MAELQLQSVYNGLPNTLTSPLHKYHIIHGFYYYKGVFTRVVYIGTNISLSFAFVRLPFVLIYIGIFFPLQLHGSYCIYLLVYSVVVTFSFLAFAQLCPIPQLQGFTTVTSQNFNLTVTTTPYSQNSMNVHLYLYLYLSWHKTIAFPRKDSDEGTPFGHPSPSPAVAVYCLLVLGIRS